MSFNSLPDDIIFIVLETVAAITASFRDFSTATQLTHATYAVYKRHHRTLNRSLIAVISSFTDERTVRSEGLWCLYELASMPSYLEHLQELKTQWLIDRFAHFLGQYHNLLTVSRKYCTSCCFGMDKTRLRTPSSAFTIMEEKCYSYHNHKFTHEEMTTAIGQYVVEGVDKYDREKYTIARHILEDHINRIGVICGIDRNSDVITVWSSGTRPVASMKLLEGAFRTAMDLLGVFDNWAQEWRQIYINQSTDLQGQGNVEPASVALRDWQSWFEDEGVRRTKEWIEAGLPLGREYHDFALRTGEKD